MSSTLFLGTITAKIPISFLLALDTMKILRSYHNFGIIVVVFTLREIVRYYEYKVLIYIGLLLKLEFS